MEDSLAARIVLNHLDLLEKHRYAEIAKALGVSVETVGAGGQGDLAARAQAGPRLRRPGAAYIVPDVFIHKMGDDYVVSLNESAVPRLRLSGYYQRVLNDGAVAETPRSICRSGCARRDGWSSRSTSASRRSSRSPTRS